MSVLSSYDKEAGVKQIYKILSLHTFWISWLFYCCQHEMLQVRDRALTHAFSLPFPSDDVKIPSLPAGQAVGAVWRCGRRRYRSGNWKSEKTCQLLWKITSATKKKWKVPTVLKRPALHKVPKKCRLTPNNDRTFLGVSIVFGGSKICVPVTLLSCQFRALTEGNLCLLHREPGKKGTRTLPRLPRTPW